MTQIDSTKDPMLQLVDWVERYLRDTDANEDSIETMRELVWEETWLAWQGLFRSYVIGRWDLPQDDLAQLWLLARSMGYRPDELIPDSTLADAVPGRAQRPADPPGDFVQIPPLMGGGHGPGRGKPGKREFPASWPDDEVTRQTMDVAQHPAGAVKLPTGDFLAYGERLGIAVAVVVSAYGQVEMAYPVDGDGVMQNLLDDERVPHVARLRALLDRLLATLPADQTEPRRSLEELMAVGEWPYVVKILQAVDPTWTAQHRDELEEMAHLCDVRL